ncbi:hypothetical protein PG993_002596 [Apiospora rasikravindrae]|uniref:Uncharacterized protein n=1 Tax=Apiospora rasikravindrae TaxID=990691 RepID=A0ABR1TX35_9PEZI
MQLRRSVSQTFGSAHPALHTAVSPTATREDDEKRREIWRGLGLGVNDRRTSTSNNSNGVGENKLSLHTSSTSATTVDIQLRLQQQLQRLKQHTAAHNNQSSRRSQGAQRQQEQQQRLVNTAYQIPFFRDQSRLTLYYCSINSSRENNIPQSSVHQPAEGAFAWHYRVPQFGVRTIAEPSFIDPGWRQTIAGLLSSSLLYRPQKYTIITIVISNNKTTNSFPTAPTDHHFIWLGN